jgi:hypothetical protein
MLSQLEKLITQDQTLNQLGKPTIQANLQREIAQQETPTNQTLTKILIQKNC